MRFNHNEILCYFDIISLFTNITVDFTTNVVLHKLLTDKYVNILRRESDPQKAVAVVKHHYQSCLLNAKRTTTRMYLRGLGNL